MFFWFLLQITCLIAVSWNSFCVWISKCVKIIEIASQFISFRIRIHLHFHPRDMNCFLISIPYYFSICFILLNSKSFFMMIHLLIITFFSFYLLLIPIPCFCLYHHCILLFSFIAIVTIFIFVSGLLFVAFDLRLWCLWLVSFH